jgi:hypothetical protein
MSDETNDPKTTCEFCGAENPKEDYRSFLAAHKKPDGSLCVKGFIFMLWLYN